MYTRLRHALSLLFLLCLLAACSTQTSTGTATPTTRPTSTPTMLPTATAVPANADVCPKGPAVGSGCLTPHLLSMAYGIDKLQQQGYTGKGQTIIDIVSFGSPTLQEDMKVFDQQFGLPPIDLQIISPLHEPESDPQHDKNGWAGETTLDVQVMHAIAPDAKIVVLVSPVAETEGTLGLPEFRQLIQYTLDNHLGTIVSCSWGASEATLTNKQGQQELAQWNTLLQQSTTTKHITYITSSGDDGAANFTDLQSTKYASVPVASFPAASPWMTSVGGTMLTHQQQNTQQAAFKQKALSTFEETAWNRSGGGFSQFYQQPDYQKTLPQSALSAFKNRRGFPDVSAPADPTTGLAIYQGGDWGEAGGTSASAPLWAGLVAIGNQMAGHPLGFLNPTLYKLAATDHYAKDFRDITQGNNDNQMAGVKGYDATKGWDPITGLGSPQANNLLIDLKNQIQ